MLAGVRTNTIPLYMTQSVLSVSKVLDLIAQLYSVLNISLQCVVLSCPLFGLRAICLLNPHISLTNIRLHRRSELCFFSSAVFFHYFLNLQRLSGADRLLWCPVNGRWEVVLQWELLQDCQVVTLITGDTTEMWLCCHLLEKNEARSYYEAIMIFFFSQKLAFCTLSLTHKLGNLSDLLHFIQLKPFEKSSSSLSSW